MPNGSMIEQLQNMLEDDATIPQNVTNGLVLAAIRETYKMSKEVKESVDCLSRRVTDLEQSNTSAHKETVTWPYLWEKFGTKVIEYILIALLAFVLARFL